MFREEVVDLKLAITDTILFTLPSPPDEDYGGDDDEDDEGS